MSSTSDNVVTHITKKVQKKATKHMGKSLDLCFPCELHKNDF